MAYFKFTKQILEKKNINLESVLLVNLNPFDMNLLNNEIQSGQPIYKVLASESNIPIMFTSMFRIGEETGELSQMIDKLADFYEEELASTIKSLTSIIEPLMIVFVAGIVATILIAMYLPMLGMMNTVG